MKRIKPARKAAARQGIRRVVRIGVLVVLVMAGLPGCQGGYAGKMATLRLGALPASPILIYIAKDQQFFAANGLNVSIKDDYASGIATTEAVLNGEMDLAWTTEFPIVSRAFEKQPLSILASVGRFTTEFLIARKDRGIVTLSDLKGRAVGVPVGTISEFYLGRFLTLNGMDARMINFVDTQGTQALDQIINGNVEGVVERDPFASQLQRQLGDQANTWSIQNNQPGYGLLVARKDWVSTSPGTIRKLLKALIQAEDYLVHHPTQAKSLVQKHLNVDDPDMQTFWSEIEVNVTLDQSLVLAMEDEARWMMANNLTAEKQVPNFLDTIYEGPLKTLKPEAVKIIR